jgi:hypothetical protein
MRRHAHRTPIKFLTSPDLMMPWINLENPILRESLKNHSGIDEEPKEES